MSEAHINFLFSFRSHRIYNFQCSGVMEKVSGLSNRYILRTLKKLKVSHLFTGVYSSDTVDVPLLKEKEEYICIVNLSKKTHPGSHFVTVIGTKKLTLYADSLALPSSLSPQLHKSLQSLGKKISPLNSRPIQAPHSVFCGFFAIFYCIFFDYIRFPLIKGQKTFLKNDLHKNDTICLQNIKEIIKSNPV